MMLREIMHLFELRCFVLLTGWSMMEVERLAVDEEGQVGRTQRHIDKGLPLEVGVLGGVLGE